MSLKEEITYRAKQPVEAIIEALSPLVDRPKNRLQCE